MAFVKIDMRVAGAGVLDSLEAWDEARAMDLQRPALALCHGYPIATTKRGWPVFKHDIDEQTDCWVVVGPVDDQTAASLAAMTNGKVMANAPRPVGFHTDG